MSGELVPFDPAATPTLTAEQKQRFLEVIEENPTIGTRAALRKAGVARPVEWRSAGFDRTKTARQGVAQLTTAQAEEILAADPDLAEAYEVARGRHPEQIRAQIKLLAIDGIDEPVYQGGQLVGTRKKYSESLLALMARANLPEYREQRAAETIAEVVDVDPLAVGAMSVEERMVLRQRILGDHPELVELVVSRRVTSLKPE